MPREFAAQDEDWVRQQYAEVTAFPPPTAFSANITVANSLTPIHFDAGASRNTQVGGCRLWVFYPKSELRNWLYFSSLDLSPRDITRNCLKEMRNGVCVVQKDGESLSVDPQTLHLVITIHAGILIGRVHYIDAGITQLIDELNGGIEGLLHLSGGDGVTTDLRQDFCDRLENHMSNATATEAKDLAKAWGQNSNFVTNAFRKHYTLLDRIRNSFVSLCERQHSCIFCQLTGLATALTSTDDIRAHFDEYEHFSTRGTSAKMPSSKRDGPKHGPLKPSKISRV